MRNGAKKSLYVFLSSLLGLLIFLVLHRLLSFGFLWFSDYNYQQFGLNLDLIVFSTIDYFTLILSLLLGCWYGIWLGLYWYEQVYELGRHSGLVDSIARHWWPVRTKTLVLKEKIQAAATRLEEDAGRLENLAVYGARLIKAPVARKRIVKKKVLKKLS